jgi:acyl carrier protein
MSSDIAKRIFELASEHSDGRIPPDQITREHHLINDLAYDSLEQVEFGMDVEDEFELSVPDEDLQQFKTVGDVIDYVEKHALTPKSLAPSSEV